jgi:hypothetical protein
MSAASELRRLHVTPPRHDESLSSFLDRAANLYGTTRLELVAEFSDGNARRGADLDAAEPLPLWKRLSTASDIAFDDLLQQAATEPYWMLPSRLRSAYCPHCFEHDLSRSRTPYFRRAWSYGAVTSCPKHRTSLFSWPAQADGKRLLPHAWFVDPRPKHRSESKVLEHDLGVLKGERFDVDSHAEDQELLAFQDLCQRAGVTGGPMVPDTHGLAIQRRLRRKLRLEFYRIEEAVQGPYQLELPMAWPRHPRRRSRLTPRKRTGRIWIGAPKILGCIEWRRILLLQIARTFDIT